MVKSLKIQNFQSHKDSTFNFSNGVNVIVGQSDSGKSSIIRALNWVVFNRPSGDSFKRYGSKKTSVDIDGIVRAKGKYNSYAIADNEPFKAFGQNVPDEIRSILNLDPINFQFQHDPPFLLSQSPGEVAKYLNEIVSLEKIDDSLAHANKRIKQVKNNIDYKEEEISQLETELVEYNWIEDADKILIELEKKNSKREGLEIKSNNISNLIWDICHLQIQSARYEKTLKHEKLVDGCLQLQNDIERKEEEYYQLTDHIGWMIGDQTWIVEYDSIIYLENQVDNLLDLNSQILEAKELTEALEGKVAGINHVIGALDYKVEKINQLETEFDELMPNTCPLCEQEIIKP